MESLRGIRRILFYLFEVLAVTTFLVMLASSILQVFFRYVLDMPLQWTEELARLMCVLTTYFGSIVVLQQLLTPFTGDSDVAVVLSTLLIAALFLPLRRRVQDVIDRRFFRRKYNAEKVLAQFAATVRDETDLDALTAELVRVVQETMQPESVSLWLKK